jgi:hypothetical protein
MTKAKTHARFDDEKSTLAVLARDTNARVRLQKSRSIDKDAPSLASQMRIPVTNSMMTARVPVVVSSSKKFFQKYLN